MTSLVIGALIAVGAVAVVSLPFFRGGDDLVDVPDAAVEERLALIDDRDRALAALKELEFDHQSGAIGDEDYRALIGPLRRAAADALQALDRESAQE